MGKMQINIKKNIYIGKIKKQVMPMRPMPSS